MEVLKIYSTVILLKDIDGLKAGSVGTIIEVYTKPCGYTVEFLDDSGYTIALLDLRPDEVRLATDNDM